MQSNLFPCHALIICYYVKNHSFSEPFSFFCDYQVKLQKTLSEEPQMRTEELLEHADYLLGVAAGKCDSWDDAQDLMQATLLEGLLAIRKGKQIDNPRNWLVTVLNRRFYDMLRVKYRKPLVFCGVDYALARDTVEAPDFPDAGELTEEENLRRLVARMTKQYREVLIRHYYRGEGVREIAEKLSLPENTVKSRLRLGRDILRKDLTMEKYEKQSFEPETLCMASTGIPGLKDEPYNLVKDDKIAMNLLILAYEKPVTLPELADAIGISTAYIEPVVERLVDGELMKRTGDKIFTDFIIYTEQDRVAGLKLQKELAAELFDGVWQVVEEGLDVLRGAEYYLKQSASARLKLEGFFAIRSVYQSVLRARDELAGMMSLSEYLDRKDGGKWYAMGNRYPADYDYDRCPYELYNISGEANRMLEHLPGAKYIALCDYDTDDRILGKAHRVYQLAVDSAESGEFVMKLLYAVYRNDESLLSGIPGKILENVDVFLNLDFLERSPDGKLKLLVPVLNEEDRNAFFGLANEYAEKLRTSFRGDYNRMFRNPVEVPKQIQNDVPDFLRYLNTCCYFPGALLYEARTRGRFLKGCVGPVPAVLMVVADN